LSKFAKFYGLSPRKARVGEAQVFYVFDVKELSKDPWDLNLIIREVKKMGYEVRKVERL
jgi:hypothetical protein